MNSGEKVRTDWGLARSKLRKLGAWLSLASLWGAQSCGSESSPARAGDPDNSAGSSAGGSSAGAGALGASGGSAGTSAGASPGGVAGLGGAAGGAGGSAGIGIAAGAGGSGGIGGAASGDPRLDPEITNLVDEVDATRIVASIETLVAFETRNSCSATSNPSSGIGAARDWLRQAYASLGLQVMLDPHVQPRCPEVTGNNVIAWLPGENSERLIVLSGHYDSVGGKTLQALTHPTEPAPGANDSGSQTAALLEAARVLAGHSFDATLVFASFSGEEQGLVGAAHFAQNYRQLFSGARIELVLNMDIVGGDVSANDATALEQYRVYAPGTPREFGGLPGDPEVVGTSDDTSPSRGVMRYVAQWGKLYVPSMSMVARLREDRPGRGGDHQAFIAQGIPGIRLIETNENFDHQHSPLDTLANMTPEYTGRITRVLIAAAASLARAPTAPLALAVSGSAGEPLNLSWSAPDSGAVDHYVIAARPVTENFYRVRHSVPGDAMSAEVTAADLDVDGEAFFVSVAAVDGAGHESLFAYPEHRCSSEGCEVQPGSLDVTAEP